MDVVTVRKCLEVATVMFCRSYFPECDRTQSVVVEKKLCREPCLEVIQICGRMSNALFKSLTIRFPKKKYSCELQPCRNAGDSPECYYYSVPTNSTGKTENLLGLPSPIHTSPPTLWRRPLQSIMLSRDIQGVPKNNERCIN